MTNTSIFSRYWRAYGGFKVLFKSNYFRMSLVISLLLYPHWSTPNWWEDVLGIMPDLVGFSLGGFAMWIAIGDDNFRMLISGENDDGKPSPYMEVNAAFVHFIVLQILSIILALFAKGYYFKLPENNIVLIYTDIWFGYLVLAGYFFSYFIFIYGLISALAATLSLLRVASWYDMGKTKERKRLKEESDKKKLEEASKSGMLDS